MKWLVIFVLTGVCLKVVASSVFQISVFSSTSKSAILRWNRVPGVTSYKISVAPTSSPGNQVAFAMFGPNTVMGSVNSLSPNVEYTFTIEALDDNQNVISTAVVNSSTAPEMMDPIQHVKSKDSRALIVEFNLKSGSTKYVIRIQDSNNFFREDTVFMSPAVIQNLTPYTEYMLSIMAVNGGGQTQPSPSVTAKTVLPPPQLSASSPSNNSITVSWAPVTHAVQYSLNLYKLGSSSDLKLNTSSTNFTITGLDAGSFYYIRASAWDMESRRGERSLYINQTTRPPTPSLVNVSMMMMSYDKAGLSVSWELDQEVHGSIKFSVISDQNLECNTSSSSCTLSPVSCGEVHSIQVTSSNEAGPGSPTDPVKFVTYPCPPKSLAFMGSQEENCTLKWDTVAHADRYQASIKRGDGGEDICDTTSNNCTFQCQCGYTYQMSVCALNKAGSSPRGEILNHTTLPCCPESVTVSVVSADTLEIMWNGSRGAELYETRAVDSSEVVLCNDTAPVCALSDLNCDSSYSVVVTPCNEISGCNRACKVHTKDTAPCTPTNLILNSQNSSSVSVSWTANNRAATYTVSATGEGEKHNCTSRENSCEITDLPCGCTFEVSVTAASAAGQSLSSFSDSLETEPCCPMNLSVDQVTQAMTNVSWSHAKGAHSFITSLTSTRGHARCHTQDSHCLMGCITCGTNYTVTMEAYSHSGRRSNCTYQGFSSSACCPSGVRVYKMAGNSVRIHWRSSSSSHRLITEMRGTVNNYTCTAAPGENSCDISNIQCGVYHVVVAPLTEKNERVMFCPERHYSITCSGDNISTVIYRRKRSVD